MADYQYDAEADRKRLEEISRQSGASVEQDDLKKLAEKAPEDRDKFWADLEAQYARRGAPTSHREFDSQSGRYDTYTHELIDPGRATSQYSGSGGASGGDSALQALLAQLQADRQQQAQERASMREILMGQLNQLQQPVSLESPGIKEAVSAHRMGLQRGGEQQRREIAERRAYDESGGIGSKAYLTDIDRLQQGQAEAGAQFEGNALFQEMQQRRDALQRLLAVAMQLGDAESARNLQGQLNAIQAQMQQSNFYDDLAFRYTGLNANQNSLALQALLAAL